MIAARQLQNHNSYLGVFKILISSWRSCYADSFNLFIDLLICLLTYLSIYYKIIMQTKPLITCYV